MSEVTSRLYRFRRAVLMPCSAATVSCTCRTPAAAAGARSYIADYLSRFRSPAGGLVVPMPAIIGSGARPT